jgi:hypothetical protein
MRHRSIVNRQSSVARPRALAPAGLGREAAMWKVPVSRRGQVILCCSLLVVLAFSVVALACNPVWTDDLALFTDTVNKALVM